MNTIFKHYKVVYFSAENFDVELMKEAASLIEGHHDFRTFMAQHLGHEEKETRRVLERLEIMEADSVGYSIFSWPAETIPPDCQYMFLNVYIQSKGFLYKQVSIHGSIIILKYMNYLLLGEEDNWDTCGSCTT